MMESDVSEIPLNVSHVPVPLKKRYAVLNSQSVNTSNRPFLSGFVNYRHGSHFDQLHTNKVPFTMQNPSRDFLPVGSQRLHNLQMLKHPQTNFRQSQYQEEASYSLERDLSIGRMIAACDAEKERLLREASRLEEAEIRQKNAREWILQNERTLQSTSEQREEETNSSNEIYLQINGRKYIAKPVETEDNNKRMVCERSTFSDVHRRRKNGREVQAMHQQVNQLTYPVGPETSHHYESKESLEEVIMKDKLAMLSQLKQLKTGNLASVSVNLVDKSEPFKDLENTRRESPLVVKTLRDRFVNTTLQVSNNRPSTSPSISCIPHMGSYHSIPAAGTSAQKLSTGTDLGIVTDIHQLLDLNVTKCPSLLHSPISSPISLSLPLSPGSINSSVEHFANSQNNSPINSSDVVNESCGVPHSKPGTSSSAGHSDVGSPTCQTPTECDSSTINCDTPNVKMETDTNCQELPHVKRPADNKCPVCSDEISGYHYGIYSCESCKGFFKRTVQNKRNERLRCARNGNCEMVLRSRKHCAACRFQKCINQGMKLEAIRGDRQRGGRSMYEGSAEYRRRQMLQVQSPAPKRRRRQTDPGNVKLKDREDSQVSQTGEDGEYSRGLSEEEPTNSAKELSLERTKLFYEELLVHNAFLEAQPIASCCQISGLSEETIFRGICHLVDHHLIYLFEWAQGLPYFRELEKQDQEYLYWNRWIHLMLSHYCLAIPANTGTIQRGDGEVIDLEMCFESSNFIDFVRCLKDITNFFRDLKLDSVERAILKLLVLLNSDVAINQPSRIANFQDKVQDSLFQYVLSRDARNVRKIGDILLRFAEIEKLCHIAHEHFMFQYMAGHLSEYKRLCEVLQRK